VLNNVLRHFNYDGYFVEVVAPMRGIAPERLKAVPLGRLTTIRVNEPGNTAVRTAAKRAVDIVLGTIATLIFAPVWAVCAIAIKIDSKGPVFFRQERVGLVRKNFGCFKFRTMVADAEKQRDLMRDAGADGILFKMEKDPRITKVGAFLRKTSLDETPQLLNVLRGEMSLVGPRPLPAKDLLGKSDERIGDRLRVRPGMTGMWQVSGRSDVTDDDFLTLDLYYVDNWSLFVDLLIIGKTIPAVLFAKGAY
jgi:exopolysaccharide biosynthesis polyprenyl glycosylphosphotransferase